MTYGQAIRNHAKEYGHEVAGKLTRHPELEQYKKERVFIDEEANEYYLNTKTGNVCCVTSDGGVY